jgi:hypothetical protein
VGARGAAGMAAVVVVVVVVNIKMDLKKIFCEEGK